jgi:predicted transcriptional regulator
MTQSLYQTVLKELELRVEDIRPSDIVLFSEPLRSALNFTVRTGRFSLTEFTEQLGFTREEAKRIADILVERNLFEINKHSNEKETYYQSRISAATRPMNRPPSDIWKKIE